MKKRRKKINCLNCGAPLPRTANYCPNCGQENTDHQISLGLLLREITSNFFSLDSRFARTFKPFLFNPGKITNAFIEGKRVSYANPIRWYLVISIFHFFFMARMFEPTVKDRKERGFGDDLELTTAQFDSLYQLPDSAHTGWPLSNARQKMANHLIETTTLSADEIIDSLKIERGDWKDDFVVNKFIRINQETRASLNDYLLRQIPIIIFFVLPIYAFLLKVFFWRKGLYIKHLIHSIHLHSFLFFFLGLVWLLSLLIEDFEDYGLPASMFATFIYVIISFKKVYRIKLRWSIFRAATLGIIYTFFIGLTLVVGILVSLAMI